MREPSRRTPRSAFVLGMILVLVAIAVVYSLAQDRQADPAQRDTTDTTLDEIDFRDEETSSERTRSARRSDLQALANPDPDPAESSDEPEPCPNAERTQIRLFRDAQVRPLYQHRTMLGVRITGVKEESLWRKLDIDEGDLIIESSGRLIDSPQASVDLLNDLERAEVLHLRIQTRTGRERWIDWQAPPSPDPKTIPKHCR